MTSTLPSSIYDPPPSFSLVHPGLYRSSVPTSAHFSFLTALHLTSIVSLGPELPSKALQSWASTPRHHGGNTGNASIADHAGTAHATSNGSTTSTGIRFIHLGNQRCILAETRDWRPVQDELIKDALEFILDKRNLPCLVMDQSGVYETGILVGCLRRLERWSLSAVLAEYASIAGSRTRPSNEQFIELFDPELVTLPDSVHLVDWFHESNESDVNSQQQQQQQQQQQR